MLMRLSKKISIFLITTLLSNSALAQVLIDPTPEQIKHFSRATLDDNKAFNTALNVPTPTPSPGPTPAVFLHFQDPAPFEGFLLPKAKVDEFRDMSLELQKDVQLITSLNTSLSLEKDNASKLQNSL